MDTNSTIDQDTNREDRIRKELLGIKKSMFIGLLGLTVLYVLLMSHNIFASGRRDVDDLTCLVTGFTGITGLFAFIHTKRRIFLVICIPALLLSICSFLLFLLKL